MFAPRPLTFTAALIVGASVLAVGALPAFATSADAAEGDDLRPGEAVVTHTVDLHPTIDPEDYRGLRVAVAHDGTPVVTVRRGPLDGAPAVLAGLARPDGSVDALVPGEHATAVTASGVTLPVSQVRGAAADPDGGLYVATDSGVHHVDDEGTLTAHLPNHDVLRRAIEGEPDGPTVGETSDVAVGRDGRVYVASADRVTRWDGGENVTVIAGGGKVSSVDPPAGRSGTDLNLVDVKAVDVGADGSVYLLQGTMGITVERELPDHPVVLRIAPDGTATRMTDFTQDAIGGDEPEVWGDKSLRDLSVGADGTVYVADSLNGVIRTISPDGAVGTVGPGIPDVYSVAELPDGHLIAGVGASLVRIDLRTPAPASCGVMPHEDAPDPWADEEPGSVLTVDDESFDAPVSVTLGHGGTIDVLHGELPYTWHTMTPNASVKHRTVDGTPFPTRSIRAVAHGTDGVVYIATDAHVLEVHPDGSVVALAGGGQHPPDLDAGAALLPSRVEVTDLECGPDGSLYVATSEHTLRIDDAGDVSVMEERQVGMIRHGIGVGPDGTPYSVNPTWENAGVLEFGSDGERSVVAGGGDKPPRDGTIATDADVMSHLHLTSDVAAGRDGTLYVSTHKAVRSIDADGELGTAAVLHDPDQPDRKPAGLAVDAHGNVYVADGTAVRVVVRPHEQPEATIPWGPIGIGVAVVLLVPAAWFGIRRRTVPGRTESVRSGS